MIFKKCSARKDRQVLKSYSPHKFCRKKTFQCCFHATERYDYVGKLLKPGEAPTNYSDEEDEGSQQETETKSENYETESKTDRSETEGKNKSD